ncbi:MAG: hypothetical protein M1834_003671 [Cirrosporium novae-zelandiae]|nr:MAG: hypothetical protein M1834_003671 [Cirrosporium novae-zelandiae]
MESFEKGFKTDFKPAISAIKVQQIRFTSSLKLNESGEWYRVQDPTKPTYVGTPSPDIDHAWNTLLTGRYVNLTGTQKADLESEGVIQEFHHGFYAGPDVFHSLHCLNALRKVIYKDYYAEEIKSDFGLQSLHIDHCMDQLRQAVQCAGDLTPVTIVPVYNGTLGLGETERTHTCRNFQSLLDWKAELKTAKLP